MTQLITTDPKSPAAGDTLKICYSGERPVKLELQWHPDGLQPDAITIPAGADPCVTITVPAGAWSLVIHDTSGASDDLPVAIS